MDDDIEKIINDNYGDPESEDPLMDAFSDRVLGPEEVRALMRAAYEQGHERGLGL